VHWYEKSGDGKSGSPWRHFAALGIRLVVAAIFLYASADKILHPAAFAQMVYNYHLDFALNQ
jgi:hypothetical protein